MSDQTKVKAKGTPKTEAIIGAASNKFVVARKGLQDAVAEALKLTETMDEQALKIADNEEKLQNLQTEYSNKKTQQEIELGLAFRAGAKEFADKYLRDNHMIAVSIEEYDETRSQLTEFKEKFDERLNAEVGKAKGMAESQAKNAAEVARLTYEAKEAQNIAEIKNLQSQLNSVKEWNQTLQNQLNAERSASVDRAKAASVGAINVAAPSR